MQVKTKDVKSKGDVVGTAKYAEYDSTAEAVEAIGEKTCLGLINAQVRTNSMNAVRAEATGTPSEKALRKEALSLITMEEFQAAAGNPVALEELINRKVSDLKEAREADAEEADDEGDEEIDDEV